MLYVARCCLPLLIAVAPIAAAQTEPSIPWAFGAYFGTGYYELGTGEETYVLSVRPSWRWREANFDEQGKRSIGVEFRVPVAVGAYRLDDADLAASLQLDNVSTLSVVPGVEIEVPMGERWSLKPLAYVGWGTHTDGDDSAWIYWAGIKSRLRFGDEDFDWALVNALTYVGYSSDANEHGNALPLLTAFEFGRPLGDKKIADQQVRLHWHIGYTDYLNDIELLRSRPDVLPVQMDAEWEIGMAFSTGEEPLRLWRLKWDRVGVVYRVSADGEFRGVGLVFRSLFDR